MKKKNKKNLQIGLLIFLVFSLAILTFLFVPQSIIGQEADYYVSKGTDLSNSYLLEVTWSNGGQKAYTCNDPLSVSGSLSSYYRNQNVAPDNFGYKVEKTIGNNPPQWLKDSDGERFNIKSVKVSGKNVNNVIGTCELDYTGKDRMERINDRNEVVYDWYIRPIDCSWKGNVSKNDVSCIADYAGGKKIRDVWVFQDSGKLTIEFPKESTTPQEIEELQEEEIVPDEQSGDLESQLGQSDEESDSEVPFYIYLIPFGILSLLIILIIFIRRKYFKRK